MKNKIKVFNSIVIVLIFTLSATSCSGQSGGGGRSFNNAEDLKKYLDSQPANSPDKPIRVSMTINDPMFLSVASIITSAGKYVSLNITGNALTAIPNEAFFGNGKCETLISITIPNSVTSIGEAAFDDCRNLTSVIIPDSVTSIGGYAFYECTSLTSVTIPNSVTIIGNSAFEFCTSLTSVSIGKGVTSIGNRAFRRCESLISVTIPDSVTNIDGMAFGGCESLTSVTFQGTISSDNSRLKDKWYWDSPFDGDLGDKYLASNGGPGTYKRFADDDVWKKQ